MTKPSPTDGRLLQKVLAGELRNFCMAAMKTAGFSHADSRVVAEILVTTDTWGIHSHGSKQLRLLLKLCPRRINPRAVPKVVAEGPGWGIIDGCNAMAMISSHRAMSLAIAKARTTGIAFAGVRNGNHFGAAAYYANMAQAKGMIGLAMCNTHPLMTVPGARKSVLGTNPIAYAVPAGKKPPLLFDIATSVVAGSKVIMAKNAGLKIPNSWLVDADGLPTTDPRGFPEVGALLPMAGHKGYGIALLAEILSAAVTGAAMMSEVGIWIDDKTGPINQGHGFIAINPGVMMPLARFKRRIDRMIEEIQTAPKAKGASRIYVPGEREWETRTRYLREGIPLPDEVMVSLAGLAQDRNLDLKDYFSAKPYEKQ